MLEVCASALWALERSMSAGRLSDVDDEDGASSLDVANDQENDAVLLAGGAAAVSRRALGLALPRDAVDDANADAASSLSSISLLTGGAPATLISVAAAAPATTAKAGTNDRRRVGNVAPLDAHEPSWVLPGVGEHSLAGDESSRSVAAPPSPPSLRPLPPSPPSLGRHGSGRVARSSSKGALEDAILSASKSLASISASLSALLAQHRLHGSAAAASASMGVARANAMMAQVSSQLQMENASMQQRLRHGDSLGGVAAASVSSLSSTDESIRQTVGRRAPDGRSGAGYGGIHHSGGPGSGEVEQVGSFGADAGIAPLRTASQQRAGASRMHRHTEPLLAPAGTLGLGVASAAGITANSSPAAFGDTVFGGVDDVGADDAPSSSFRSIMRKIKAAAASSTGRGGRGGTFDTSYLPAAAADALGDVTTTNAASGMTLASDRVVHDGGFLSFSASFGHNESVFDRGGGDVSASNPSGSYRPSSERMRPRRRSSGVSWLQVAGDANHPNDDVGGDVTLDSIWEGGSFHPRAEAPLEATAAWTFISAPRSAGPTTHGAAAAIEVPGLGRAPLSPRTKEGGVAANQMVGSHAGSSVADEALRSLEALRRKVHAQSSMPGSSLL